MKRFRGEFAVGLLALAGIGCGRTPAPDAPGETHEISADSGPERGKMGSRIDWNVVARRKVWTFSDSRESWSDDQPLRSLQGCEVYVNFPSFASKPLKKYLIEIDAYTENGKLYAKSGREICFLDRYYDRRESKDGTGGRHYWETHKTQSQRDKLGEQFHVLIILNAVPYDRTDKR